MLQLVKNLVFLAKVLIYNESLEPPHELQQPEADSQVVDDLARETDDDVMSIEGLNDDQMTSEAMDDEAVVSETKDNDVMTTEIVENDVVKNETTDKDVTPPDNAPLERILGSLLNQQQSQPNSQPHVASCEKSRDHSAPHVKASSWQRRSDDRPYFLHSSRPRDGSAPFVISRRAILTLLAENEVAEPECRRTPSTPVVIQTRAQKRALGLISDADDSRRSWAHRTSLTWLLRKLCREAVNEQISSPRSSVIVRQTPVLFHCVLIQLN